MPKTNPKNPPNPDDVSQSFIEHVSAQAPDIYNKLAAEPAFRQLRKRQSASWGRQLSPVISLLTAKPANFYGRGHCTEELWEDSRKMAGFITPTNWLNTAPAVPFLLNMFQALPAGNLVAVLAGVLILRLMNIAAEGAAANRPSKRGWAYSLLGAYVGLNLLTTGIGGIGSILVLGRPTLSKAHAEAVIAANVLPTYQAQHMAADQLAEQSQTLARRCEQGKQRLTRYPRKLRAAR